MYKTISIKVPCNLSEHDEIMPIYLSEKITEYVDNKTIHSESSEEFKKKYCDLLQKKNKFEWQETIISIDNAYIVNDDCFIATNKKNFIIGNCLNISKGFFDKKFHEIDLEKKIADILKLVFLSMRLDLMYMGTGY
jgi:hypothetical protein